MSKSARRRKRNKEKEANKAAPGPSFGLPSSRTTEQQDAVAMAKYLLGDISGSQNAPPPTTALATHSVSQNSTQNMDPDKRIKNLRKVCRVVALITYLRIQLYSLR